MKELIKELEANGQILFKYCDSAENIDNDWSINPNGTAEKMTKELLINEHYQDYKII